MQVRILVTHGLGFLPQCDKIIVMKDGRISEMGTYTELMEHNETFAEFLHNFADHINTETPIQIHSMLSFNTANTYRVSIY